MITVRSCSLKTVLSSGSLAVLVALSCLMIGCTSQSQGPPKSITTGKVMFNGEPVLTGMIHFIPESGPPVQTAIKNGEYLVEYKGGVTLGHSRVEIEGFRETGKTIEVGRGKTSSETVQFIPKKYNMQSTLSVEITNGKTNQHDFNLE